jgi:hypothetical protein
MSHITNKSEMLFHVADLIANWGHCDTNRRHALLDMCLLFHTPHCMLVENYRAMRKQSKTKVKKELTPQEHK